ncbi:hypothetical protein CcaverHIS002_0103820 [Cutaneotrichosporon cavernicola]|uniref:Uncharacterized protein n=1 Tax=Cutaneotrichosporon cavernicola TaxID=279322 RepID=A0AA48I1G1_9TREE|nr:uncharacterized protein CcaverHIS019_0103750 [Cutaneotrichosporon cavernicola]BEI79853.1 hypothetical protein CcaverHIS002_0103820 [Cutaneotrichosporon cavernicola]BEI87657.1 hypothetical protein CcaverHIS019_0103750 [Cutaneotrichosporon cavernicola]BEI95429.1 hypothetical protein CcaverHIS631_0103780 [Cutaneotrichosporon cavernicola]BEJ03203.1 hypothetical protein CcaverHIS641_0103780 [Cutaneotrichosporon cavernicola]
MNRPANSRIVPVLSGDETRYRRRYRALKDIVNELSDESNLLALRVYQIQRRIYDAYMAAHGRAPPPVPVPEGAAWSPLVQNATHYPADIGKPSDMVNGKQRAAEPDQSPSSDDEARDVDAEIEDMMDDY